LRTYPDDTSHTLMVLSLLAETNLSPSCVNLTVEILWSCPCNVLIFLYSFAVSHNFIVRSVEHVTDISFLFLITVSDHVAAGQSTSSERLTHNIPLCIEINIHNSLSMPFHRPLKIPRFPIPNLHRRILTGTRQNGPGGMESYTCNWRTVGCKCMTCCAWKEWAI